MFKLTVNFVAGICGTTKARLLYTNWQASFALVCLTSIDFEPHSQYNRHDFAPLQRSAKPLLWKSVPTLDARLKLTTQRTAFTFARRAIDHIITLSVYTRQ